MAQKDPTNLFDFIHIMFNDQKTYDELKNYEKARHQFMVTRFMSIQYPEHASVFNKNGINAAALVDCWQMVARRYKRTPGWIFTRVRKTEKQKEKEYNPNEEVLRKYLELNQIGMREYKEALGFNFDGVKKELKMLEKQMMTSED